MSHIKKFVLITLIAVQHTVISGNFFKKISSSLIIFIHILYTHQAHRYEISFQFNEAINLITKFFISLSVNTAAVMFTDKKNYIQNNLNLM